MAKALAAAGLQPDLVLGTSVGSINGAVLASAPVVESVVTLAKMWDTMTVHSVFQESLLSRLRNLVDHWSHQHSNESLSNLVDQWVPYKNIEDAAVHFECVAACVENASEHWFTTGSVSDAILASCALPGVLPPFEIDGRHYIDGGVVNSIPISRAVELGATEIYVLHVGHIDDELDVPRHPWAVAMVSFEIARRHRFHTEVAQRRDGVTIHVMPTGRPPGRYSDLAKLRHWHNAPIRATIAAAESAGTVFLEQQVD